MRLAVILFLIWLPAACVTPPSEGETIEACRDIPDRNLRDRCIANVLREAENDRQIKRMLDRAQTPPEHEKQDAGST